jgi:hypothetical protein
VGLAGALIDIVIQSFSKKIRKNIHHISGEIDPCHGPVLSRAAMTDRLQLILERTYSQPYK